MKIELTSPEAMESFGLALGQLCPMTFSIYLQGDLGAGKTTLARGILRACGFQGKVKSPTYTLVESYSIQDKEIFHFDLYRLQNAEELANIGFRDYFSERALILLEWPEKAETLLPPADLQIAFQIEADSRILHLQDNSERAEELIKQLQ
ncbi:MAG: tRNA (adenosine(37)-N6)-threonylcarbamoyltransferase complex ATPase subunit type 1 TsaE [Gammaproteobacteria bacterium]|nr:tRNA (adenosine(37)-N6)-threonylcarbamoyltransferase complex ATPase subunit type 1 TsaE [Gammaproteobacteria bacterium]